MKRTLKILAAGLVGLSVGVSTTSAAPPGPGNNAKQAPRPAAPAARPAAPAPRPAAPAARPAAPAARPAAPASRPAPTPTATPRPAAPSHPGAVAPPRPATPARPAPATPQTPVAQRPVNPTPRPAVPVPGPTRGPVATPRPAPTAPPTAQPAGPTRPGPGPVARPNPAGPAGRPGPNGSAPANRGPNVTITNINNNSSTTINRSSTTINTRPAGGRGPFVNVVTPRGPGINGRGPVIINTGPRVLPGLVGGTVVAGGFLPPVTFVRPVPVINVVTAAPDVVPVPVYVPQPVAAVPADPNAGAVAVAPAGPEASTGPTQQAAAVVQTARYLRVKNNTGEGLRVFVQHYSQTANGEWAWLPKDPRTSTQAEEYRVAPGTDAVLGTPNGALAAHAVRLWAVSDSGREWVDYKNADLPLVPEQDPAGNRYYQAETIGTFTLNFDA